MIDFIISTKRVNILPYARCSSSTTEVQFTQLFVSFMFVLTYSIEFVILAVKLPLNDSSLAVLAMNMPANINTHSFFCLQAIIYTLGYVIY